jgi:hypothetical protein
VFTLREEFSMPKIAAYHIILEGEITLPTPEINDHEFPMFLTPNVDVGSPSILVFRVNPHPIPIRLGVLLNGYSFEHIFRTDQQRSWHQVIPANHQKVENQLTMAGLTVPEVGGDRGVIRISEIVLFFQVNIP